MRTDSSGAPDERDERQQPTERGGAADIDRSKGLETDESTFGGRREGGGEADNKSQDE
jgi:hypothetical protein